MFTSSSNFYNIYNSAWFNCLLNGVNIGFPSQFNIFFIQINKSPFNFATKLIDRSHMHINLIFHSTDFISGHSISFAWLQFSLWSIYFVLGKWNSFWFNQFNDWAYNFTLHASKLRKRFTNSPYQATHSTAHVLLFSISLMVIQFKCLINQFNDTFYTSSLLNWWILFTIFNIRKHFKNIYTYLQYTLND